LHCCIVVQNVSGTGYKEALICAFEFAGLFMQHVYTNTIRLEFEFGSCPEE